MIRRIVLHTLLAAMLVGGLGALYQGAREEDGLAGPAAPLASVFRGHERDHDD